MQGDGELLRSRVEAARRGDVDAWEWIYRRMYQRLYSFARRRLPGDAAAADAVSETMTRALDGIDGFEWRGAGFEGWLFGVCRNVIREHQRAAVKATTIGNADLRRDEGETDSGPEAAAEVSHERAVLREAFSRLDDEEQEILDLRIVAELSAEDTGQVIGKRAGAVRTAQSRALKRLRTYFREVSRD